MGIMMKLYIDIENNRVLFAEAGKDCVDLLFSILSLPVGRVIALVREQGMKSALPNLYRSIEKLNHTYIKSGQKKDMILQPMMPYNLCPVSLLQPENTKTFPDLYRCDKCTANWARNHFSDGPDTICQFCDNRMKVRLTFVDSPGKRILRSSGFVESGAYMIMDDLEVKPMSIISITTLLQESNVKNLNKLKEQVVNLTMTEVLKLLKSSLESDSVLTDAFLKPNLGTPTEEDAKL